MDFTDKVVIVTGGGRGIGAATALLFAREGAKLSLFARTRREIEETSRKLKAEETQVLGVVGDVRHRTDVDRLIKATMRAFRRIDVLINNAGVALTKSLEETTEAEWDEVMDTNIKGIFLASKAVLPAMKKQKQGAIVNISSGAGKTGFAQMAAYCSSKFAVLGFTESLAKEVRSDGILVYAVCPGTVQTKMTGFTGIPVEKVAKVIMETAAGRTVSPGEAAEVYG